MKSEKCRFQIDQFQGSPSPRNAFTLASKNRRRLASRSICLPKSFDSAMVLSTVRTNRLGRQSSAPARSAGPGQSSGRFSGAEAGNEEATESASVSAILATCSESQKQAGGSGCGSSSETVREARIRTAFLVSRQPSVVQWTPGPCPGSRVCEHMPFTAKVMDRLAVIRSMHHPMTNHKAAAFTTLCGRDPLKGDLETLGNDRNDPPCYGSALSATLPERRGLPTFVAMPHVMHNVVTLPGQVAGFLGSAYNPFQVDADPNAADFRLAELDLSDELSLDRLNNRASLLSRLDARRRRFDAAAAPPAIDPCDVYTEKAFRLLHSPEVAGISPEFRRPHTA